MIVDAMTITDQATTYTAVQQSEVSVYAAEANEPEDTTRELDSVLFGLLLSAPLLLTIGGAVWVGIRTLG